MGIALKVVADAYVPLEALTMVDQRVGLCIMSQSSAVKHTGVTVRPLWTRTLRRQSVFFHREDNRSPLIADLSTMVLQQARELGLARKQPRVQPS